MRTAVPHPGRDVAMPAMITVAGPRPAGTVGGADAHGHLWIVPALEGGPTLDDEALALAELADFSGAGGTLVVDCQPGWCGRDGRVLARLALSSGVAIVAATGFHLARYYAAGSGPWSLEADAARALFARELRQGLGEAPGVRAGIVKAAWTGERGREVDLMRAALRAARDTGAGVVVHTEAGRAVEALARVVEESGLSPDRVQISHIDKRPDLALHAELARAGFVLGYDTFLRPRYEPERNVWPLLRGMIAAGWWRQITLGLDLVDSAAWRVRGGAGLRWLTTEAEIRLRRDGAPDETVRALVGGNAGRLVGVDRAYAGA